MLTGDIEQLGLFDRSLRPAPSQGHAPRLDEVFGPPRAPRESAGHSYARVARGRQHVPIPLDGLQHHRFPFVGGQSGIDTGVLQGPHQPFGVLARVEDVSIERACRVQDDISRSKAPVLAIHPEFV